MSEYKVIKRNTF